ncbi:nitroreductase family deazaflavin-dependent oxidoreductase [Nocardia pseudobrasiliensis]|nr:nitroreductase family deazaflavin-dependent oxidoreductase [Nocardia pseudobrasiliensis]
MPRNPLPALGRAIASRPLAMRAAPAIIRLERLVRRLTRGKHGVLDIAGLPSIELTVAGRKSGLPRTVSLLYVPEGPETYLLVGSNWGRKEHPVWSVNLSAADHAELHSGGERFKVRVRRLEGGERAAAWQRAVTYWPGYAMEARLAQPREFRLYELTRL